MTSFLQVSDFDFALPESLIARYPQIQRDQSRLLCVLPDKVEHSTFSDLPTLFQKFYEKKPLLVVNNTQVMNARMFGYKFSNQKQGAKIELLVHEHLASEKSSTSDFCEHWRCLYRANKPLREGTEIIFSEDAQLRATVLENEHNGNVKLQFTGAGNFLDVLQRIGKLPLPPYMNRQADESDQQNYQTFFAQNLGAVAAPTAGLHFTKELVDKITQADIQIAEITLHVGLGTFMPIKVDTISDHIMHKERFHISPETVSLIARAKAEKRPVIAVGTTVVRALESATLPSENVPRPGWADTQIFIYPSYHFRVVDGLITNFHLPKSTLIMLVAAFAGKNRILSAYQQAINAEYRFFSYGDAMFIPQLLQDDL